MSTHAQASSPRRLSTAGQITNLHIATDHTSTSPLQSPTCTRKLALRKNSSYDKSCQLLTEAKKDLRWWIKNLPRWNERGIMPPSPDMVLTSDASQRGLGGHMQGDLNRRHVVGGGETVPHKLPRTEGSLPGPSCVRLTEEECPYPVATPRL